VNERGGRGEKKHPIEVREWKKKTRVVHRYLLQKKRGGLRNVKKLTDQGTEKRKADPQKGARGWGGKKRQKKGEESRLLKNGLSSRQTKLTKLQHWCQKERTKNRERGKEREGEFCLKRGNWEGIKNSGLQLLQIGALK